MAKKPAPKKPAAAKPAAKKPAGARAAAKPKSGAKPGVAKSAASSSAKTKASPQPSLAGAAAPAVHGLVIGCDCYLPNRLPEGSYGSLNGCVRDALGIEAFLVQRAGLDPANLTRLTSTAGPDGRPKEPPAQLPTYENIVGAFRAITGRAKKGDRVYIHYSGHGGRCRTIVPQLKGPGGLDEGLVPVDIGDSSARYVRDVEIARLLKEMDGKGLVVTVVLDCCHSGGVTRRAVAPDDKVGVRGVDFIDSTPRPAESLVGTPEELAAAGAPAAGAPAAGAPAAGTRAAEGFRGMAAAAETGPGVVVLAACRPMELAREYPFDGLNAQGALTYWFLQAGAQGGDDLTFRTAYDLILARVHGQFAAQTPMLFGDADRPILGGDTVRAAPAVPVINVDAGGQTLTLGSGSAGLVGVGAEFAVYPAGAKDLSDASARIAAAQATAVRPADCTARVTENFGPRGVQVGDRAVPVGVAQKLVRRVRVLRPDGGKPKASEPLGRVVQALAGQKWVEAADGAVGAVGAVGADGADGPVDFLVTTTKDGAEFRICDPAGDPIPLRPELATVDAASSKKVVSRLIHLARYQAIRELDNGDPLSPLRGQLVVEWLRAPAGFQKGDATVGLKPYPPGQPLRLKPDQWVVLAVTNRSDKAVNAVVLDLASDWSVAIAHPEEPFHAIDPGDTWRLELMGTVPNGLPGVKDVLKVMATVDPPPAYELLTLPALDRPIPRSATRSPGLKGASPLDALLDAASADNPSRAMTTGGRPTGGWAVAHAEVVVGEP